MVHLDLSAAFDTIDHQIFISRLFKRTGVRSTDLSWFQSYLSGWSSQVDIAGNLSNPTTLEFGLPQESILFQLARSPNIMILLTIFMPMTYSYIFLFDPKTPGALDNALTKLQTCISNIRKWMVANKLKLNDSKTEFFVPASAHTLRNLPKCSAYRAPPDAQYDGGIVGQDRGLQQKKRTQLL